VPGRNTNDTAEPDAALEPDPTAEPEYETEPEVTTGPDAAAEPVMPSPRPFPTFHNRPTLPHQVPGGGFESGRDSRAR